MGTSKSYTGLIALVLGIAVAYLLYKKGLTKGKEGDAPGSIETECDGLLSNESCHAIAGRLRDILDSFYVTPSDETTIVALFKSITDECSYRKVFQGFGHMTHYFPPSGEGDLEYWMRLRMSEDNLFKCRVPGTNF